MKQSHCCVLLLCAFACLLMATPVFGDSAASLEKLKGLVGNWEGASEWSGARTGGGKMDATYTLTGNGTAVVENLISEGKVIMTSVYHLDGPSVMMTHYCGVGNQPRLKASPDPANPGKLSFQLVDITNLATPDAPHVSAAQVSMESENDVSITFSFEAKGKTSTELIRLHRVK